jgi:hypothetical protein
LEILDNSGQEYQIAVPSVEDVQLMYDPPPANFCKSATGEVFALASCVYHGVTPMAYDAHRNLCLQMAWDYGPGNVWVLPTMARLTYPFAPLYAFASLLKTEKIAEKRADWIVWIDDDTIVPKNLVRKLREDADPVERPFVAALGFDRYPPFRGAAWTRVKSGEIEYRKQWIVGGEPKPTEMLAPSSGVHRVDCTGLCAAIFHRSFFDRVPQPWFSSLPPVTKSDGDVDSKINPDAWLCKQAWDAGVPVHVSCNVKIGHIGLPVVLTPDTVPAVRAVWGNA